MEKYLNILKINLLILALENFLMVKLLPLLETSPPYTMLIREPSGKVESTIGSRIVTGLPIFSDSCITY